MGAPAFARADRTYEPDDALLLADFDDLPTEASAQAAEALTVPCTECGGDGETWDGRDCAICQGEGRFGP